METGFIKIDGEYINMSTVQAFKWSKDEKTLDVKIDGLWRTFEGEDAGVAFERLKNLVTGTR